MNKESEIGRFLRRGTAVEHLRFLRSTFVAPLLLEPQIVVFKNDKKSENQPDYDILLSEPKEEKGK